MLVRRNSARSPRLIPVRSIPSTATDPASGRRSPEMRERAVDFPLPDSPRSATTSPSATAREKDSRTEMLRRPFRNAKDTSLRLTASVTEIPHDKAHAGSCSSHVAPHKNNRDEECGNNKNRSDEPYLLGRHIQACPGQNERSGEDGRGPASARCHDRNDD